jgi:hypothetical protein
MKARTVIPIAIVAILLLGGVALDVPGNAPAVAQTCEPGPAARYIVEQGAASGGRYRLTSRTWQVCGTASGGAYRLLGPEAPALLGSGCCCTYLPLVLR